MAEQSKIEWTDHTFNPWEGCQKVAPECDNCYAEARDARFTGGIHWGPKAPRRRTSAQNWQKPLKWNAQAEAFNATHGRRQRVFCASLADVFDNAVDPAWRSDLWALIRECDQLDWLLLTKRPQNMAKMLPPDWNDGWPNVWLGTSAGTQKTADQNIPHLLKTPAAIRFVSAEPMLGPVNLLVTDTQGHEISSLRGIAVDPSDPDGPDEYYCTGKLDWVICGGESGPSARPMHPDWARSLRDQCRAAGVAFFFKQWGEWSPILLEGDENRSPTAAYPMEGCSDHTYHLFSQEACFWLPNGEFKHWPFVEELPAIGARRVGKRAAGRMLDGREWNEVPG